MPHQQVPQIKAKATVKEYRASLGKGCSQLCIGSEDDVSVQRTTLIPPMEVKQKCGSLCPGRPSLPSQ